MLDDPLLDEFRKLEQSLCAHDDQPVGHERAATWRVCAKCGRVTAGVGEYSECSRDDLERARMRAAFPANDGRRYAAFAVVGLTSRKVVALPNRLPRSRYPISSSFLTVQ